MSGGGILIDIYGNTITIGGGGKTDWIYTRSFDGCVINLDGTLDSATANNNALATFNTMCPTSQYVAPVIADFLGFSNALLTDPAANATLRQNAATFLAATQVFLNVNPGLLKVHWAALIASPPGWLTSGVQNKILGYAATYNILLV